MGCSPDGPVRAHPKFNLKACDAARNVRSVNGVSTSRDPDPEGRRINRKMIKLPARETIKIRRSVLLNEERVEKIEQILG